MKKMQFTLALLILVLMQFGGISLATATVTESNMNGKPASQKNFIHQLCEMQAHKSLDQCLDDTGYYDECFNFNLILMDGEKSDYMWAPEAYEEFVADCSDIYSVCKTKSTAMYNRCVKAHTKKPPVKNPPVKKNPPEKQPGTQERWPVIR